MLRALAAAAILLVGCTPPPEVSRRAPDPAAALPPMRSFEGAPPAQPLPSNAVLAQAFMDLSFRMESGAALPRLTRYEGPVRIAVTGPGAPTLGADLDALLARMRREAGLDVGRTDDPLAAQVVVQTVPLRDMRRAVPTAACFVVPNARSWEEYRRERRTDEADWTLLEERSVAAVFVPAEIPPQELRDCLHEELAQAVGPLGDLWRLPGSVFNDDNFHAVLTSFDMLMLRATYAPELASGMAEAEVARRLPEVLARLNPGGGPSTPVAARTAARDYAEAIDAALAGERADAARRTAAAGAAEITRGRGDPEEAFALYVLGRLTLGSDTAAAARAFGRAGAIYARSPVTAIHAAHVGVQEAALALRAGEPARAAAIAGRHRPAARRGQNAALLATLGLIEAEALEAMGRRSASRALRLDSLGWARYGFGGPEEIAARLSEVAALAPRPEVEPSDAGVSRRNGR